MRIILPSVSTILRVLCLPVVPLLASCTVSHVVWYDVPGTSRIDPATLFADSTGRCILRVALETDVPVPVLRIDAVDSIRIVDLTAELCPVSGDSSTAKCLRPVQAHATTWLPGRGLQMVHADSFPGLPAEFRVVRYEGNNNSAFRLEFYPQAEPPARGARAGAWRGSDAYKLRVRIVLETDGRARTVERTFRIERREHTSVHMMRIGGC